VFLGLSARGFVLGRSYPLDLADQGDDAGDDENPQCDTAEEAGGCHRLAGAEHHREEGDDGGDADGVVSLVSRHLAASQAAALVLN
jgi:hypothetical protein